MVQLQRAAAAVGPLRRLLRLRRSHLLLLLLRLRLLLLANLLGLVGLGGLGGGESVRGGFHGLGPRGSLPSHHRPDGRLQVVQRQPPVILPRHRPARAGGSSHDHAGLAVGCGGSSLIHGLAELDELPPRPALDAMPPARPLQRGRTDAEAVGSLLEANSKLGLQLLQPQVLARLPRIAAALAHPPPLALPRRGPSRWGALIVASTVIAHVIIIVLHHLFINRGGRS
mmetsp:Transcript_12915/g.39074  ORF Transcript_12915/g.39074 Transcript_12915/m.39074 type:complete len:227 (+) Transcript_12915:1762-2442(+)